MKTGAAVARDGAWHALPEPDLGTLIRSGPDAIRRAVEAAGEPLADPVASVPLRPGKIVAIGLNYMDHIPEAGLNPTEARWCSPSSPPRGRPR